ncbi:MAG: DHH family phosphoesterase, partial [Gammaproteobacteria bacterium]
MYFQGVKKTITTRPAVHKRAAFDSIHPVLERIFLTRGASSLDDLDRTLTKLPSPSMLTGMETMVAHLVTALEKRQRITVIADFDADGATSCAVALRGLKTLGAGEVGFVVPNRFEYGYGLTPEIVELVKLQKPDVLITVDNGISSIDGVKAAKEAGMTVLVTDHHLPGHELPEADAIVNPNLPDDRFPSKALAGVGVMFYILMALRSRLRDLRWFERNHLEEPNLARLLDLVALGTVSDVVELDRVNRILVHQGLLRVRMGRGHPGVNALIEVAGRKPDSLIAADLGFALGPRINAAGRLDDMSL